MIRRLAHQGSRVRAMATAASILFGVAGCSDGDSSTKTPDTVIGPAATLAVAPGECAPPKTLASVEIRSNGTNFKPTFGVGSSDCAGATGEGYLVFDYNPALIDAGNGFEVIVTGEVNATLTWPDAEALKSVGPKHWKATGLPDGCERLTIDVSSTSGDSRATYGADIRIGGDKVPCPLRDQVAVPDTSETFPTTPDTPPESLVLPPIPDPMTFPTTETSTG